MPAAVDEVEVDERQQAAAAELVVVPADRPAPPRLLDAPAVTDLDGFAGAFPAEPAAHHVEIDVDVDTRVMADEPRDPRTGVDGESAVDIGSAVAGDQSNRSSGTV